MLAAMRTLLEYAAQSEGRRRIHLLAAAGEVLRAIPFDSPEVQGLAALRADLLRQVADARASASKQ